MSDNILTIASIFTNRTNMNIQLTRIANILQNMTKCIDKSTGVGYYKDNKRRDEKKSRREGGTIHRTVECNTDL